MRQAFYQKYPCASRSLWTPLWQEAIKKLSKTPQGRGDKRELQNARLEKLGRQKRLTLNKDSRSCHITVTDERDSTKTHSESD